MEITLLLGAIRIHIVSDRKLIIDDSLQSFVTTKQIPDIEVHFSWDWEKAKIPKREADGIDLLQNYYIEKDSVFCITRGGPKGFVAVCQCSENLGSMICTINEKPFICRLERLGALLRFLPMRMIFQQFDVLFFHAAQIALKKTGILFTAPSGIGKSTQAKLWEKEECARLICGDRTLTRWRKETWNTYGYPIDGSSPVRSSEVNRLGCIVLLSQAKENKVERLSVIKAVGGLMPQMVIDSWNVSARTKAMEQLLVLVQEIPVYHLACTQDVEALYCLKEQLRKDGVI